jgi:hypothetical protein
MSYIQVTSLVPFSPDTVFAALSQPAQLRRAWADHIEVEVLEEDKKYSRGAEILFRMTRFGISQPLRLVVEQWEPPHQMTLKQVEGPFKYWVQNIKLESHSGAGTLVTENINYSLPYGLFGNLADDLFVRSDLEALMKKHLEGLEISSV